MSTETEGVMVGMMGMNRGGKRRSDYRLTPQSSQTQSLKQEGREEGGGGEPEMEGAGSLTERWRDGVERVSVQTRKETVLG